MALHEIWHCFFEHAMRIIPNAVEATTYDSLTFTSLGGIRHHATNTNAAVGDVPGLIGSKTGFTDLAGGNLVVAFDAGLGHPIIAVVLGSSFDGRFDDMKKLVAASLAKIAQ